MGSIWDEMHVQYRVSYWSYRSVCGDITFTLTLLKQVYLCKGAQLMREKPRGHCILAKGKRGMRELALVCLRLLSYVMTVATLQMANVSLFLVFTVVQRTYNYDLNPAPYRS